MTLPKVLVAVFAIVVLAVEARTALHADVAADMDWEEVRDFGEAEKMPLTEEQEFKQNLYYELHPERQPKPEPVTIRFVESHEGDGAVIATPDSEVVAMDQTDESTDESAEQTESEDSAEAEESDAPRFAQTESESEAESESESESDSELERVASMADLSDEEESEGERAGNARYEMDAVLHSTELPAVQMHMSPQYENRQPVATVDPARFQQISAAVSANTAAFHAERASVLGTASQQTWSEAQQRELDAALDAAEAKDAAEEEAEADDESDEEDSDESEEQDVSSSPAMIESESSFHSARAAREAPANSIEEEEAALRENELSASMLETGGEAMMPTLPGHEHDQYGGDMRFARVHAPLPEDKDSRLYYARSLRGKKIRRMIRRGEMLYRYAPELMSKVFDPARKIDKPGVQPSFAQAMDGPLGPITPPPADGTPKPPAKGSIGPRFAQIHNQAKAKGDDEEEEGEGDKKAKGGDAGAKGGAKGSADWIAKKLSAIDQLIKNPIDQRATYPQMYQHWDNYMFPMRQKPLPPRWYPYPKKGRNPISAFPPAASLFENPAQRGPLQTPNPLFQNPRGSNGLQPIAPPFFAIGSPSAPSPYASPLGYARFPGGGAPAGTDAGANGVLGPRNHPIFSAHPLPLQKWYQKFIQPAEAPTLSKPPGQKGGEEGGGEEKEEKEEKED